MSTIYVALDVEATGMNPAADRIIEVAAVKFTLDRVLDRWQTLVRPGVAVPYAITALTGITTRQVADAPLFAAVAPALRAFVRDAPIVGHSVELDLAMLRAAGLPLANPVIDTYELAALLLPELPAYGLSAVAAALRVAGSPTEQHRASADTELTRLVFARLWERLLDLEAETLGEIVALTAGSGWPLHRLFAEAQRLKTRESFGTSLGGALRAAMGVAGAGAAGDMAYLIPRARPEQLAPTGTTDPIDAAALERVIAPEGAFARLFADYEHRPQQVEMMRAVARAFNEGERLLVEAGTGTGKSMAYLLPAVATAVRRGETVVISTKTIQLQDQLFTKDIPLVQSALAAEHGAGDGAGVPAAFKAALVKGRSNYLCLRRWFALRRSEVLPREEVRTLVKILLWLQGTETGDRAELRLLPGEEITWARVMATPDACAPATCPYNRRGQCFLYRARREAEAAHVVVVNHALLLSDMATNSQVLPEFKHLVIDEAHRLEDEATAQLGFSVDRRAVTEALDAVLRGAGDRREGLAADVLVALRVSKVSTAAQREAETIVERLAEAVGAARGGAGTLFTRIDAFVAGQGGGGEQHDPRVRLVPSVRHGAGWAAVERAWEEVAGTVEAVGRGLADLSALVERQEAGRLVEAESLLSDVVTTRRAVEEVRLRLNAVVVNPDPGMVYWCETNRASQATILRAAPLEVAASLQAGLYQGKQTVVLTSATLTTDNSFRYVRDRLGLEGAHEVQVGSPFDYRSAALLYLVNDLPEPGRPGYQRRLEQGLVALFEATGGRGLALFTSHSALRATYQAIKGPLEAKGILVLGQRIDGSPRQLLERLRATGAAVVLGTASFWEGVDVVGDALSVLVIVKLPFQVPSDPVFAARGELLANPFAELAVPQTILTFKQGFGRLIRGRADRGVVAVLDSRLLSKSYGRLFIQSLPDCTRADGALAALPERARGWLAGGDEAATPAAGGA